MNHISISAGNLQLLREVVFRESEIWIKDDDVDGVVSRLLRLVKSEGVGSLTELLQALRESNKLLTQRTIDTVTINETSFFRDNSAFSLLSEEILPQLGSNNNTEEIKIWCAGCSTGQEAYSIAITALGDTKELTTNVSIIATDVSPKAIEKAQSGHFTAFELRRGISENMRKNYFTEAAGGWQVRPEVRQLIKFEVSNMNKGVYSIPTSFDIVFLRNVMIYFNESTRENLIRNIKSRISPGGYLFVGSSERVLPPSSGFTKLKHVNCQYYQLACPPIPDR